MRVSIFLLGLALLCPGVLSATTYVVRPDGTGDFQTIQAAIDAAVSGDFIELSDGTFEGDGNRDIDYLGKSITVRSQSGQPGRCIIDCEGSPTTPRRGFVMEDVNGSGAALEGVTVLHGYTRVSSLGHGGGAVFCHSSVASLSNCVFSSCGARSNGGLNAYHGEVLLQETSFERNTNAGAGGAV